MSAGEQLPPTAVLDPAASGLEDMQRTDALPPLPDGVQAPDFIPDHMLEGGAPSSKEHGMSADEMYARRDSHAEADAFGRIYEDQHSDNPSIREAGTYLMQRMKMTTPERYEAFTYYSKARDVREKSSTDRAHAAPTHEAWKPDASRNGSSEQQDSDDPYGWLYRPRKASDGTSSPEAKADSNGNETDSDGTLAMPATELGDPDDVTSLAAYRKRTREWAKSFNVDMTDAEINAEAARQRKRDFKPGLFTRARNRAYKLRQGPNDPRIVEQRDKPEWYQQYQRNVGDAAIRATNASPTPTPKVEAQSEDDVLTSTREFSPSELDSLQELLTEEADSQPLSVDEQKRRMQERYKNNRRQEREKGRAERRERRRAAVRKRMANMALSTYFMLPEPMQAVVANAAARRNAARNQSHG
jgi:hypothetical protein